MPSDTASTACDPRSEVAPEPEVPKGPAQTRQHVLAGCSPHPPFVLPAARSTTVVPPQVQQDGTRGHHTGILRGECAAT